MDEIKNLSEDALRNLSGETGFNTEILLKDYYLTAILYLVKDVDGIYFKGGTALQKIFLNYSRLSEDADFTLTRNISEVKKQITIILEKSGLFRRITKDKDVEGFTRLVAHYKDFTGQEKTVFIDLNQRAVLFMSHETHSIVHFYKDNIPAFSVKTLAEKEIVAEKIAAAIGRNMPRDHFDIYRIIKANMPIDLDLARKKCEQSGVEFDVTKMFNKAKKLKHRWDEDLLPLLSEEANFQELMKTLAIYFKLKEEKERKS